jgi:DNA-binding NarL/FixJ family response regulator
MNIVIIEQNKIFRESLKTALDQIPDFNVVLDTDNYSSLDGIGNVPVHEILIDDGYGKANCDETIRKALSAWPDVKFLLLTTYKEDYNFKSNIKSDVILKNSSKKEFEYIIKKQQSMEINNLT